MPEKRRLSLSFSLAQREQRDAWERLSAVAPGQRMEAVCRMINGYMEQQELLEPIRTVIERCLHCEASSLQVINRPPTRSKPLYMKVWEARKNDGLNYEPDDPEQNLYLAQITKYALRNID